MGSISVAIFVYLNIKLLGFKPSQHYDDDLDILHKIEFTSERKKMSMVVKDIETGIILLICKGADTAIYSNLSEKYE